MNLTLDKLSMSRAEAIVGELKITDATALKTKKPQNICLEAYVRFDCVFRGEGGIRTLDTLAGIHAFQACSFGRSDTSP